MRHPVQALVLFLILVVLASALLASHQRKPFPLLVDEAHATMIVCNPVLVPDVRKQRAKRIQKV